MSDNKIIPFGKYKGQEIEQVIARDPQYVQWIMQQAWFEEKFPTQYQVVVNVFAPPSEDTPAHNALQVRFLDDEYRNAFWDAANIDIGNDMMWLREQFWQNTRNMRHAPMACPYRKYVRQDRAEGWMKRIVSEHRVQVQRCWATWRFVRQRKPPVRMTIGKPIFEGVTDVVFPVSFSIRTDALERMHLAAFHCYRLGIEIKPSMGDDYPTVLRQIKRQQLAARFDDKRPTHWFLLVDEFAASNVTLDQVQQIFGQDNIRIIMLADLREQLIRL